MATHDTEEPTISVRSLTKAYGRNKAVDNLNIDVMPGRVTGFLGPNGAGKTTTLRMLLGLVKPTDGTATILGKRYDQIKAPATVVGAGLEAAGFVPGRTGIDHLRVMADASGIPAGRAGEVLALVGLSGAAKRRVGGYSLGMKQRLSLAGALLGDPEILIMDEPSNGLDPEGIAWLRAYLRSLAREGRTVLVSSHILSEVETTVDEVIVIANGRLVHRGDIQSMRDLTRPYVEVSCSDNRALASALDSGQLPVTEIDADAGGLLKVHGVTSGDVGHAAFAAGLEISHLVLRTSSLEQAFLGLVSTNGSAQAGTHTEDSTEKPVEENSAGQHTAREAEGSQSNELRA